MSGIKERAKEVVGNAVSSSSIAARGGGFHFGGVVDPRVGVGIILDEGSPVCGVKDSVSDASSDGGEEFVIDDMELWGDGSGRKVENAAHGGVVFLGVA